ncbi:PREDICTED: calpain-12-like, partial [Gekko japonicus]|uniref:Calpain-12-like n=1 Tax=Gekko japonicus TaxID=146911 RepID=A0ABM1K9W7_GEKJA
MAPSGIKVCLIKDSDAKRTAQVLPYRGQSYKELKQQCLQKRTLFTDPEFEASKQSLGPPLEGESWPTEVVWKRPKDISGSRPPQFISDGMTRFDVLQNQLGDCWFLAAAASLTLHQELLRKVVPLEQTFEEEDYAGIFHFRFWQYGEWVDVVVDDRLPTVNGKLYFGRYSDGDEFWMPLLEKAYAKLNGSYGAINGGHMKDAFVDFTGGIGERIYLKTSNPPDLFKKIQEALSRKSLMAAGIPPRKGVNYLHGLVPKHAYSVTGIHELRLEDKEVKLLRLRNPYGEQEWKGPWSDGSELWLKLDSVQREKLCVAKDDGEFWMHLGDFAKYFNVLDICHLSPNAPGEEVVPFSWNSSICHGSWVKGHNAIWMNPQFHVSLPEPDEAEKGNQGQEAESTLLVSLMKKTQRRKNKESLFIRFDIFKVPETYLKQKSTDQRRRLLQNPENVGYSFEQTREIAGWFHLPPGNYVIIPSAPQQWEDTVDFTIRIFTKKPHQFSEIDGEISAEEKTLQGPKGDASVVELTLSFSQVMRPLINGQNRILYEIFMEEAGKSIFTQYDLYFCGRMNISMIREALEAAGRCKRRDINGDGVVNMTEKE